MIKEALEKLLNGYNLTPTDIKEVFDEIVSGLADEILVSSFLTALKLKGESTDEISAAILSCRESFRTLNSNFLKDEMFENVVFGNRDGLLDISFAVDIVLSASDLKVFKYSLASDYNFNQSFQTFNLINNGNFDYSESVFERTGFIYFLFPSCENYVKYTKNISRALCFSNLLNITDKMLSPLGAKNQVIGLVEKDLVEKYADICLKLNNHNTLALSGVNGFPFASIEGETFVAEAWKNKIFTYIITPELVGLKAASFDEIKCENSAHGLEIIKNVFENKIKNAPYDIIVLTSALSLYITKKADSIMDGILLAKKIIDSNLAREKLEQLIKIY